MNGSVTGVGFALVSALLVFLLARHPALPGARSGRLGALAFALLTAALAITGFGPLLAGGGSPRGYVLLSHTALGGPWLVLLAWLAVRRAASSGGSDRSFWGAAISGAVAGAVILVAMTGLAGTEGQRSLVLLHRYASAAALVFSIAACVAARRPRTARSQTTSGRNPE